MNRYLIIGSGLVIGASQIFWQFFTHWEVTLHSPYFYFDLFFSILIILCGVGNNKYLYLSTFVLCFLFLLLEGNRLFFLQHYRGIQLHSWYFLRATCLVVAQYGIIKCLKQFDISITN